MRDRTSVVYIDTCRVDAGNAYQPDIGSTRPLLSTAIGRALILAGTPAARVAILNRLKVEDPKRFAIDKPVWEADQKAFEERGYCYSRGDWRKEVHAVAVPIRQTPARRTGGAQLHAVGLSRGEGHARKARGAAPAGRHSRDRNRLRHDLLTLIRDPTHDPRPTELRRNCWAKCARFVQTECMPLEAQIDRDDEIPEALVQRMRELGLFGHSIPEAYGGAGLTSEELSLVNIEVSQAATTFRARFGGNTGIASESLVVDGTEAQKATLPAPARQRRSHRLLRAHGARGGLRRHRAEARAAVRDGDDYLITGRKCFITNAPIADLFTVFARTERPGAGAGRHHGVPGRARHARA